MQLLSTSIGKKLLMAVTGLSMVMFACIHLVGNLTVYGGVAGINVYAHHLHSLPWPIIAAFRVGLLTLLVLHACFGISLAMENSAARPEKYAISSPVKTTFAGQSMIWTGLLLLAFILFHLLHFTFQVVSPDSAAKINLLNSVPNVFGMVVSAFSKIIVSAVYIAAMIVFFLHVFHGIQSFFQTVGLNNGRTMGVITKASTLAALVLFLGYVSIPLTIFANILK